MTETPNDKTPDMGPVTRVFDYRGWGIGGVPQPPETVSANCCICGGMAPITGYIQFLEDGGSTNRPACRKCLTEFIMERWPHLGFQTVVLPNSKPFPVEAHHPVDALFLNSRNNRIGGLLK